MTDPRTPLDLDAIAKRHTNYGPIENLRDDDFCSCGQLWPCDASLLLAALRASQERERRLEEAIREYLFAEGAGLGTSEYYVELSAALGNTTEPKGKTQENAEPT